MGTRPEVHDLAPPENECENCGSLDNLALCTRCRTAWFCSVKCQRAYWPFHKSACASNDFADALEHTEPRFARWMRKHGKVAVLKDDEVDRLERKVATLDDMYGKRDPGPRPASYDVDDLRAMRAREERVALEARQSATERLWASVEVPEQIGLELERYKWRQNQSYVEVFVLLPPGAYGSDVRVTLSPTRMEVAIGEDTVLSGELFAAIKAEESVWLVSDGMIEIVLLKRNRRGFYQNGKTNADTFWYSLLAGKVGRERLQLTYPPHEYYTTDCDLSGTLEVAGQRHKRGGGRRAALPAN